MAYDIIIKSGTVLDGSGKKSFTADIGLKGDKISAIGDLSNSSAETIIPASGRYITPGFIDVTNHSDTHLTIFKYSFQESLVAQGVTTIIGGNCGTSLAPLADESIIHSIQKWTDPSDINVDWLSFEEFLTSLEKKGLGVNFGSFVGLGTLRRGAVMDVSKPAGAEERQKMRLMLEASLDAGAFGLSSGLAYSHEKNASEEELISIVKILKNDFVYSVHIRSEGKEFLASVNEVLRIARESGARLHISHLKAIGRKSWQNFQPALKMIDSAVSSGIDVTFDQFPYRRTGSLLYLLLPSWVRDGGFGQMFEKFRNPEELKNIISELKNITLHYDKIVISTAKNKSIVGKTILEIADSSGIDPENALLDILLANEGHITIFGRTLSMKNFLSGLSSKFSILSSDGAGFSTDERGSGDLVHPRCFGAFPHFLHKFVSERKVLTWEDAIKKITSMPAEKLGIKKRGRIEEGYFADLTVFDPVALKDRATYRNPYLYPLGMGWVLINGQVVFERGKFSNKKAGRILRKS